MSMISLAALLLGLILSFIIARGITRPINRGVEFAEAVASGDFDRTLDVDQEDQVGQLCKSLKKIAETIKGTVGEFDRVVSDIEHGRLDTQSDPSRFAGGFSRLIAGANRVAGSLANLINELPLVFFTVDAGLNIQFANQYTKELMQGLDVERGASCAKTFRSEACGTDRCFCRLAMDKGNASGDVQIVLNGDKLDLDINAKPLTDGRGEVVGAFEIGVNQSEIRKAQVKMVGVAANATEIADRLSVAAEQLAGQVNQITKASEVQRSRMTETATAMEEMNATVLEVARNAADASKSTSEAQAKARDGAAVVTKSVGAISHVHDSAVTLQENMHSLGQQVESIGQIINVINDIADQTNLLALNAAIEAARAGEAGRGFAVVADEVRKLAEKTLGATKEVEQSVTAIQESAVSNIKSMESALKNVKSATELSNQSGRALEEIVSLVTSSASKVEEIATASEQQSTTSEEINRAVDEVHHIIGETAEGMVNSSKAVNELMAMSKQLNELIKELQGAEAEEA
ncbi:MAG: HAMP domain-containing protein [Desulfovibrionaceae bacterium]|nr:HAMP domain-containing protein [Desulfovibrionaceae bacterium]